MRISDWSSDVCSSDLPSVISQAPRRTTFGPSSIRCWTTEIVNEGYRFTNTGNNAMRIVGRGAAMKMFGSGIFAVAAVVAFVTWGSVAQSQDAQAVVDRKSTRMNSSL